VWQIEPRGVGVVYQRALATSNLATKQSHNKPLMLGMILTFGGSSRVTFLFSAANVKIFIIDVAEN